MEAKYLQAEPQTNAALQMSAFTLSRVELNYGITKQELFRIKNILNDETLIYLVLQVDRLDGHRDPTVWTLDDVIKIQDRFRSSADGEPLFSTHKFYEGIRKLTKKGFCEVESQLSITWME